MRDAEVAARMTGRQIGFYAKGWSGCDNAISATISGPSSVDPSSTTPDDLHLEIAFGQLYTVQRLPDEVAAMPAGKAE